jgi:catechol 2,3-dioxygenase-like lactoylglutathione lyase family enzyme
MKKVEPMNGVPDLDATVAWYQAIGWELTGSHGDEPGKLDFAHLSFGDASLMFVPTGGQQRVTAPQRLSLWIQTSRLDELYALLKNQQLERSRALLAGEPTDIPEVNFTADLYTAFYGQREFGFMDPNGIELMFAQPV